MYHIFFMYSSIDGQLAIINNDILAIHVLAYHVLAIINNDTVNIGVYVSI